MLRDADTTVSELEGEASVRCAGPPESRVGKPGSACPDDAEVERRARAELDAPERKADGAPLNSSGREPEARALARIEAHASARDGSRARARERERRGCNATAGPPNCSAVHTGRAGSRVSSLVTTAVASVRITYAFFFPPSQRSARPVAATLTSTLTVPMVRNKLVVSSSAPK